MSELADKILGQGLDYCPAAHDSKGETFEERGWWYVLLDLENIENSLNEIGLVSHYAAEHRHDHGLSTEVSYFRQFMNTNPSDLEKTHQLEPWTRFYAFGEFETVDDETLIICREALVEAIGELRPDTDWSESETVGHLF